MTDVIGLIDDMLDHCVRRRTPAILLGLTEEDHHAIQDHKKRFPIVADASGDPTEDDPRERYLHVPIERSTTGFSFVLTNMRDNNGRLMHRRTPLSSRELKF
jgi:hypothetical protein